MRISDWSSDVCSSDLVLPVELTHERAHALGVLDQAEELGVGSLEGLDQLPHRMALDRAFVGLQRQLRASGISVEVARARLGPALRAGDLVQLLLSLRATQPLPDARAPLQHRSGLTVHLGGPGG